MVRRKKWGTFQIPPILVVFCSLLAAILHNQVDYDLMEQETKPQVDRLDTDEHGHAPVGAFLPKINWQDSLKTPF